MGIPSMLTRFVRNVYPFKQNDFPPLSFAQSVSVAAIMAKKHGYSIDANQVCTECLPI